MPKRHLDLLDGEGQQAEVTPEVKDAIFEGGPSKAMVEAWKAQYGENSVFCTEFEDGVYIWRCLTRHEYKDILKLQKADALYREERICERCVLWPQHYNWDAMNDGKAGTPSLLAEQVMDKSGFTAIGEAKKL